MPFGFAAAALGSAVIGGIGAQSAADTQAQAANNASATQLQMFQQTQNNLQPFISAGSGPALNALLSATGTGPQLDSTGNMFFNPNEPLFINPTNVLGPAPNAQSFSYSPSPGFQSGLNYGIDALNNQSTLQGGPLSGNAMKELLKYSTSLTNQDFYNQLNLANSNYWNNVNTFSNNQSNVFNKLLALTQTGANAGANLGQTSANVGNQIGSNIIGAGNAQAAGTVGAANSLAGGVNSLGSLAFLQQYMNQNNNQMQYIPF